MSDARITAEIKQIESSTKQEDRSYALEIIKTALLAIGGLSALSTYIGKVFGGG